MYDKKGNMSLAPSKEFDTSKQSWVTGSIALGPFQSTVTGESSSKSARSARLPLADLSNIPDTPMCSLSSQKPSWTLINCGFSDPEAKLDIAVGKKRASPPKQKSQ